MINQVYLQQKFEDILAKNFSQLQPIKKWNQIMWHLNENLIVSLVHLSKKSKFCIFNNPNLDVGIIQRWSSTTYSNNIEVTLDRDVDWENITKLISDTVLINTNSQDYRK